MNRIYRTLWSVATQSWQAVPETAKTAGKKSVKSAAGGVIASVALSFTLNGAANAQAPPAINQLPTGGTVSRGTATISQTATAQAAAMTVNQSSQRAVVNWNTFNLGQSASINFVQPNAQAVTLNRVNDSNPSQIFGRIQANGQVFLTNANGVYFSPTSSVDVGALTATTHSISDDNFMSGKYVFERNGATGKVVNEGNITAALSGYVALLAPEVQNSGVVVARAGTVALAAGEMITLKVDDGGSLASLTTTPSTIATLIQNKQAVLAPDGQIILSAVALNKLQAGVIKNSGRLEANSLVNKGGKIYLEGDDITLDRNSKIEAKGPTGGGTVLVGGDWQGSSEMRQATQVVMEAGASIDASATDKGDGGKVVLWSDIHNAKSQTRVHGSLTAEAGPQGGNGGQIETSGHYLNVDNIAVSTKSDTGKSGEWLLDPYDITISTSATGTAFVDSAGDDSYTPSANSSILASALNTALGNGNVTLSTGASGSPGAGAGNITLSSNLSWSTNKVLTLNAAGGLIGASTTGIAMTGGGGLVVNQAGTSSYAGIISGNGSVTKQGTGTLTLSGLNTYDGGTTVQNGVLRAGVHYTPGLPSPSGAFGPTLNSGSGYNTVTVQDGGTLELAGYNIANRLILNGAGYNSSGAVFNASSGQSNVFYGAQFGVNPTVNVTHNLGGIALGSLNGNTGGSFTKLGAGTLTMYGAGTNTGTITVSAGTLVSSGATVADTSSPLGLNPNLVLNGTLDMTPASSSLQIGSLTGTGLVTLGPNTLSVGAGDVSSSFAGTFSSTTGGLKHIGTGTFSLARTGSYTFSVPTNISAGAIQFDVASPYSVLINGAITGSGNLMKTGTGSLSISIAQTMTGNTLINGGSLMLSNVSGLGTAGSVTVNNGGVLDLQTLTNFNLPTTLNAGGTLRNSSSTSTVTAPITLGGNATLDVSLNAPLTLSGAISDGVSSYSLTKTGAGTLNLNGASTYDGGTVVSAGTLKTNLNSTGAVGAITSSPFGTGAVTVQTGASLEITGAVSNVYNDLNLNGTGGLKVSSTGSPTLAGAVSLSGNPSITQVTTSVFTLTGAISESVAGAHLNLYGVNTSGALNINSALSYTGNTNVYSGNYKLTKTGLVARLNSGTGLSVASGASLRLEDTTASAALSVPITIAGAGNASSGALILAGALELSGPITVASSAQINSETAGQTAKLSGSVTSTNSAFTLAGAGNWDVTAPISLGTGTLLKNNAGTATLSSSLSYKDTIVSGGSLVYTASALVPTTGSVTVSGANSVFDVSNAGAISSIVSLAGTASTTSLMLGANPLEITNSAGSYIGTITSTSGLTLSGGAQTLSGANTFGLGTLVKSGANLTVGNNNALGLASRVVTIESGATLTTTNVSSFANPITVSGTGVGGLGALRAGQASALNNVLSGPITLVGDTSIGGINGGYLTLSGLITETTPSSLTAKNGLSYITNLNNTYSGGTIISNSAMIWAGAGSTTGSPGAITKGQLGTGRITVQSGGTLEVDNSAILGNEVWAGGLGSGINYGVMYGGTSVTAVGIGAIQSINYKTGSGGQLTGPVHLTADTQFGVSAASSIFVLGDMTEVNPGTKVTVTNKGSYNAIGQSLVLAGNNNWTGGTYLGTTGSGYVGVTLGTSTLSPTATSLPGTLTLVPNNSPAASSYLSVYNNSASNVNYGFNLSGVFTFNKLGTGTMTLTGDNSNFSGSVVIGGGTLKPSALTSFGTNTITVSTGGTLDFAGYALTNNIATNPNSAVTNSANTAVNYSGTLTFSAPSTGVFTATTLGGVGDINFANAITATANSSSQKTPLIKDGTNTITLSGNNTFPSFTVSAGTLKLGSNATLNSGTNAASSIINGTFEDASSLDLTLQGVISGTGALIKSTSGSSFLNLTADNTFTGTTTVSAGTLKLSTFGTLTASRLVNNGTLDISAVNSMGRVKSLAGSGNVTQGSKTLQIENGADVFSGVISGTGAINLIAGSETFANDNTSTGTTTISSGATLTLGNGGTTGAVGGSIVDSGTLVYNHANNITLGTGLSGTGSLQQAGTGTLTLSAINSYTGATTINSGSTLALSGTGSIATSSGVIDNGTFDISATTSGTSIKTISGAGGVSLGAQTLTLTTNNGTYSGVISGTGGLSLTANTGTETFTGDSTFTGTTTIASGTTLALGNGGTTGSLAGAIVDNGTLTVNRSNAVTLPGAFSGAGALNQNGTGPLTLTGANSSTGSISVATNSKLISSGSGSFTGTTGTVTLNSGSTLDLQGVNFAKPITSVGANVTNSTATTSTITGNISMTSTSNTFDAAAGGTLVVNSQISSSSILNNFIKGTGLGTVKLGVANSYNSSTLINGGTLQVGDLSNTTATLGVGSTLTNNGNLVFYRSGALVLSAMAPNALTITGTGNITLQATGAVTVDRTITLSGANSAIYVEAGVNSAANTSLISDVTLTNNITTSNTGTIVIFAGSPTATVANGSTANLSLKMTGATGGIKYKTYNASVASLSSVVAGTRNFYYRQRPSLTITGATVTASKTYDGNTTAANALVTGGVASSAIDTDTMAFTVTGATYDTATAGTGKSMTVGVTTTSTNASWVVQGYNGVMSGATYAGTINKAALTIQANNDARFVTQSDTAGYAGVSYAGFVNGESATNLGGTLAIARSTPLANAAGTYTLTPSGFTSTNYDLTYRTGTYTIVPANQLLVRVADTTTVYGTAPSYNITSAKYVMPDNSLIDLTNQLSLSGTTYTLNDGASGNARFALGASNATYSASGNLNVGTWNSTAVGVITTSPNFSNTLTVVGTQTVTPRTLTISATAANKVYDGNTTATLSGFSDNRMTGDALNLTQTSATFATKNALPQQTVTIDGISLSGNDAGNYTVLSSTLTTTADITKKTLSLSGTSAATKTYDGTTSVIINSYGTLSGVVGSEDVQVDSLGASAVFQTKTVGTGKTVNITGMALGGADMANYAFPSTVTTTASITAKALTVTGTSVADKTYDATTTATLSSGTLSGVVSGDTVTLTQAGNFVDKNYSASPKAVTAADTISGADAGNYTLTQPTGLTASISRADLSISGVTAVDRAYNATLVASLTGTPTIAPLLNDTVSVAGTPTALFTTKDVGTSKPVTVTGYTLAGADSNNYNPIQPTLLTASVSKASLTVSGVTGTDKIYDATTTATLTGTPTVTALPTDSVSVAGPATGTFADKNVSASPIAITTAYTLAGTDAGNYNIVQPSGLSAYITPKTLSMEGLSAPASKTYDGTTTATVSGNASLKTASAPGAGNSTDGKPYTGDLLTLSGSPVGTYNSKDVATASSIAFTGMTMSGPSTGNYTLSSYAPYAATITPKDLTVKANNDANFFAIPTDTVGFNGVTYLGFVTGESVSNLSFASGAAPTITSSLSAGQRSTPGTYSNVLTPGGINSGNYHPVYQSGDFTVIPADTLLIRAGNSTVTYGTSASIGTPTASYYSSTYGLVGSLNVTRSGDAFNVTDITHGGSATVTLAPITTLAQMSHSGNAVVGSYNIGASSVTNLVGTNFSNSVTVAGTQTVTPKALTFTAVASNKNYDASNAATVSLSSSDALTGDLISYNKTAATFSDANAALAKTVTARGLTLSGADAGNYSLQNTSTTTTADITPKLVQLTATKIYDGTTSLATNQVIITTGVGSETLTYSGATLASKNVASNAINTVDGITLLNGTGANAGLATNYTFTTTRGTNNSATVTPASLTLAPVTDTKVYDGTQNSSQAVLVSNSSGSSDVVSAQQEFASKDVLGAGLSTLQIKAGYTIKDSSNADMSGNYVITSNATAVGTITPADIVVSGVSATNKTYDATRNANLVGSATVNAFSGDVVTVSGTGTGVFADKNLGTAKTVTVSGFTLSGTDAGNYNVVQPTGLTADITKADLTVSGITANNKVYDATTNATLTGNASVSAMASDVVTVSGTGTGLFVDKNAGTAKTVTVSGFTLSGTDAGNYNVVQPTGLTADITKAPLTVTADDAAKLFGNANPALTVSLSGFVGGETLATSGVTGTGTATTTATLNTTAGTAVITPAVGTLAASNYDFTNFVNGTFTINAISSLNNNEVVQLMGSQLPVLSSAQIAGFTATQLQVFSAQQLGSLSSTQLSGLTASQLGSLNGAQLQGIKPAQVALLNAAQISGVTADQLASFSTSQLLALTASQIATLLPAQLSSLSPAQISLLTSNAAASLSPRQILSLSPEQIAAVSLTQVAALTASELSALSNAQLQALTPLQLASIAPDHFAAFTPQQIMAMSITQVQNLSPEQLSTFTPAQVASISAAELAYFDARQLAAIGIYPAAETPKTAPVAESNFEAPIPVMTAIASPVASVVSPAVSSAPTTAPATMQATDSPATVNTTTPAARTGLLAITILHSTEAKPTTAGVAFEQDADTVSLRVTAAPAVTPLADKVVFTDKLTTFLVATPNGEMVAFEGTLVNNRMVIVAPSVAAKRVARTEMSLVLAAAVTSLGKERRVMLANLTGVVLDLR